MVLPKQKKRIHFVRHNTWCSWIRPETWNREAVWNCSLLFAQHQWYRGILQGTRSGEYGNPRGPGVIPGEVGQRRSSAESRPFPGNSRWCSAWLNSREASGVGPRQGAVFSLEDSRRYDILSYTSGAASRGGVIDILCLYQVSSTFCLYQVRSTFCLYQGGGVNPYSHQRLGGRYMPVERLRRRLRDWRLWDDTLCDRLVSLISNTVGGWARRSKAAASGRAASITTRGQRAAAAGNQFQASFL